MILSIGTSLFAQPAKVTIVYPKPDFRIAPVDSTFALGHVESSARRLGDLSLTVNEIPTPIHQDGGWLAWIPVRGGQFRFIARVHETRSHRLLAIDSVSGVIAERARPISPDSLVIAGEYHPPRGDIVMLSGDQLQIALRGTPGAMVWATLPGVVDSLPLLERQTYGQAYYADAVFGSASPADSTPVSGTYAATLQVTPQMKCDSEKMLYHLAKVLPLTRSDTGRESRRNVEPSRLPVDSVVTMESPASYRVSLNPANYPMTVRFADTTQTIRHAPQAGYFAIYQPMGIIAQSVGAEGAWQKLRLTPTQYAWASAASLDTLPIGTPLPASMPTTIRTYKYADSTVIECVLSGRHPFRVQETSLSGLSVDLFGVTSNIDWIRYDDADSLVSSITWNQPEPERFGYTLTTQTPIWGYDAYYRGTTFVVVLHQPPGDLEHIKGKRIVVDPGHSADPGSIGPTGLTEAQANLLIALELARELRAAGAEVTMTRDDSSNVPLNSRPQIAKKANADLFVSIHNNAQPDGINPLIHHGTATFFYQTQSQKLAQAVQRELMTIPGLLDYGLYNGNLAVTRPTSYPAILVECAFMILPEDEARLKTPEFRAQLSRAIVTGIKEYFRESAAERPHR